MRAHSTTPHSSDSFPLTCSFKLSLSSMIPSFELSPPSLTAFFQLSPSSVTPSFELLPDSLTASLQLCAALFDIFHRAPPRPRSRLPFSSPRPKPHTDYQAIIQITNYLP